MYEQRNVYLFMTISKCLSNMSKTYAPVLFDLYQSNADMCATSSPISSLHYLPQYAKPGRHILPKFLNLRTQLFVLPRKLLVLLCKFISHFFIFLFL